MQSTDAGMSLANYNVTMFHALATTTSSPLLTHSTTLTFREGTAVNHQPDPVLRRWRHKPRICQITGPENPSLCPITLHCTKHCPLSISHWFHTNMHTLVGLGFRVQVESKSPAALLYTMNTPMLSCFCVPSSTTRCAPSAARSVPPSSQAQPPSLLAGPASIA